MEKLKKEITITADLSRDDRGMYRIHCPELNVTATGVDLEEALQDLEEAIFEVFEGAGADSRYLH